MTFVACFKRTLVAVALIIAPQAYAELVIEDAWVRAVPPNSRTTAAYFTVRNTGAEEQTIAAVRSDSAREAEIHDWVEAGGRKQMVRQDQVVVPAGGQVVLQSGGLHMMMFRLDPVPAPGDKVLLCIDTEAAVEGQPAGESATEVCAEATVRHP
ncbi:copper chaperone PCu(A)C [Alcanivorax sp. 1008]|uniref:copper chaperone PCu(A)C n=1 Tax=Alcanivorax sp. 1008 TaxID=2816853 RepID=UPI001D896919|nr:copper chaperone PCu(A)C [Alcanivorax sp. 1008]MCC1496529.1 copper chaperone PCu(A)C [Alcanivorax sp. 1008]